MTIKDTARLSGCGVSTVSRVLSNHPDISEKTRRGAALYSDRKGIPT